MGQSDQGEFAVDKPWVLAHHPSAVLNPVNVVLERLVVLLACHVSVLREQVEMAFSFMQCKWALPLGLELELEHGSPDVLQQPDGSCGSLNDNVV